MAVEFNRQTDEGTESAEVATSAQSKTAGIRSFQKLDGENEDLTLILREKMGTFADTSAFNAGVKEKNTKTNKITIVKNQKLATQNFLLNMHKYFPFGNI